MRALSTASPLSPSVLPGRHLFFLLPFALPLVGGCLNCFHSLFLHLLLHHKPHSKRPMTFKYTTAYLNPPLLILNFTFSHWF